MRLWSDTDTIMEERFLRKHYFSVHFTTKIGDVVDQCSLWKERPLDGLITGINGFYRVILVILIAKKTMPDSQ